MDFPLPTSSIKRAIVEDHQRQVGRHDEPRIFSEPPGDPGLIGPGSVSWELHSDPASVSIAGVGAIIMEILHPSVMAGVQDLSSYREDPFRRARTTYGYVVTTTFASTKAAEKLIGRVKAMHSKVSGTRPDGIPYEALDPELIGWVHTCIPWGVMTAFDRFNRPLSREEKDRYLKEQTVIGRLGGAGEIPETVADLEAYVAEMRPKLSVNQQTREFFDFLVNSPFGVRLPGLSGRTGRFQVASGMGLMPEWAQELTGFKQSEPVRRAIASPSLHVYAQTLRWAYGTPAFRRLAEERVAAGDGGARRSPGVHEDGTLAAPAAAAGYAS